MRESIATDAIVLTSAEVRDDLILHLLTPEHGRRPVVAKHARKSAKRFGGALQPMSVIHATMTFREGRELGRLDGAIERASFPKLRSDLARFAFASVMIEVITHLIPPHGHEAGVYALTHRALNHLNSEGEVGEEILALFELRMLRGLGLLPAFNDIRGLPSAAIEVLEAWLESRWETMPEDALDPTLGALERLIQEVSGRPLRSRAVLSELLRP